VSLPPERYIAIKKTREFLQKLITTKMTAMEMRREAQSCLRHFPTDQFMAELRVAAPEFFGRNNE